MATKPKPKRRAKGKLKRILVLPDERLIKDSATIFFHKKNFNGEDTRDENEKVAQFCKEKILQLLKLSSENKYFDLTFIITKNSPSTVSGELVAAGGVDPHTGGGPH